MSGQFLPAVRCFLLDMDGTLYLSERAIPGAIEFIQHLGDEQIPFFCLTNNSSRSVDDYVDILARLGFPVEKGQILASGDVTAEIIAEELPNCHVYLVGTPSLETAFKQNALVLVEEQPEIVVLGFDTTLTYTKLEKLCSYVRAGLPYIATHPDLNCPTDQGPIPDIGATIAFVEASTGRTPDRIIGKPHLPIVEAVAERTGVSIETICMVGDRLYTDIAFGQHGLRTVLVLSGETIQSDLPGSPYQPDLVVADLGELLQRLNNPGTP